MKHIGFLKIVAVLVLLMFCVPAIALAAAENGSGATVVYLKDGGNGDGSAPDKATGDIIEAYNALDLSRDCRIVICGAYTQEWLFSYGTDYTGSVTFTSVYNGVDYRAENGAVYRFQPARFVCFGDTRFENMNFEALGTNLLVIAQCNPITIGEGVVMTGNPAKFTGGSIAKAFCILGGYQSGQDDPPYESDEDIHITVLSGNTLYIVPYSRNILGSYTGTAYVKIGGNADVYVLHGSAAYPNGIEVGDVKVELSGNAHIKNFYGCTQDTTEKSFELVWKSGTIDLFEWVCSYTAGKVINFTNGTSLLASESLKTAEGFDKIASNFDTVSFFTGDAPQTTAPQPDTEPPITTAPDTTTPVTTQTAVTAAPVTEQATDPVTDPATDPVTEKPADSKETEKAPEPSEESGGDKTVIIIVIAAAVLVCVLCAVLVLRSRRKK